MRRRAFSARCGLGLLAACVWAVGLLAGPIPAQGVQGVMPGVPGDYYFTIFEPYFDGDLRDALQGYQREVRGAIKTPQSFWIDSICYHAMAGECCYQLGRVDDAMQHYDAALKLYEAFSDWMMRVQFSGVPRPAAAGEIGVCPWGQPRRPVVLGRFPRGDKIMQGRIDNSLAVQRGGVVQQAVALSISTSEVVRATALCIRRRHEILGPLGAHDALTKNVLVAELLRQGPPNHWSECWVDLQLGLAYLAAGKPDQGRTLLERAVLCDGQWDHPLTAAALMALGQLALAQGDLAAAAGFFDEASYSAFQYGDPSLVEESLDAGFTTFLLSNGQGLYPPLDPAIAWARAQNYRQLTSHLLLLAAENMLHNGKLPQAASLLADARSTMARSDLPASRLGARLKHLSAVLAYAGGNTSEGDATLASALDFQSQASCWLYRLRIVTGGGSKLTARSAVELYRELLRDPLAIDWRSDPLDTLAYLMSPRERAFENWFELALQRNEPAVALEVADLARRHRFLSTQEFGGRLLGLRWIIDAPEQALGTQEALERQELLQRYPRIAEISKTSAQLQQALRQASLVPDEAQAIREMSDRLQALDAIAVEQEQLLRGIVARREPGSLAFPPRRTVKEIQAGLTPEQGALVYFHTGRGVFGFLITAKDFGSWQVGASKAVFGQVAKLLQAWGQQDGNRPLPIKQLIDRSWRGPAQSLAKVLVSGSQSEFPGPLTELIVVPDGPLWYLPFEALPLDTKDDGPLVIEKLKVRYAPLASLIVPDARAAPQFAQTAVVAGKLTARDDGQLAQELVAQLTSEAAGVVGLKSPLPAGAGLVAKLFDRVVVLDDVGQSENGPFDWDVLQLGNREPAHSIVRLLALPWGSPADVVLPGFHTAAENAMRKSGPTGDELFLNVTALMASGTRRVLISRWRTGGKTSLELMREYLQEAPHGTAAAAWQRAVLLARETVIQPDFEPRVEMGKSDTPPAAEHPFFWAGYVLVDATKPGEEE